MSTLSEDVNKLGRALGTVLREQEGEAFFDLVEQVRALVRQARAGEDGHELQAVISGADAETAANLVRAFAWYFQLVNLAEEYERVRVLESRQGPRSEGLEAALIELKSQGLDADAAEAMLRGVELGLTFTAHPTEMRRRTIRAHLVEVARDLPNLQGDALERVTAHVEAMWGTPELRRLKPTVADEVKGGLNYVSTIATALPVLLRDLHRAFKQVYGRPTLAPLPLHFSSWMGGDRDGNPNVTPEATHETLALHAARARELLMAAIQRAYADLSQDEEGVEPAREELQALFDAVRDGGQVNVAERIAALDTQLRAHGQKRSAETLLAPLETLAQTFGRSLVSLDLREHSDLTGAAVAKLLREAGVETDYASLPEHRKLEVLSAELRSRRPLWPASAPMPEDLERAVGPIREVARAVTQVGPGAFGRYIISMSESVSDVLEPLILAREVGFHILPVPLFETLDDLSRAPDIVWELLSLPEYRAVLGSSVQEIMLGYSDSNKDAGFLAANWALHEAQRAIAEVCRRAGVPWRFFHGRGTSIGRGGGPAARAILGQPAGTIGQGLRITEQGEALADKYSHPVLARRNLEQGLYALLVAAAKPKADLPARWVDALTRGGAASAAAYRALVDHPDFLPFFELVTPIHEISNLNIASRPVRRPGAPTLTNLRAIPWVMSWTQNRANLPGWYGLAEGLTAIGPELAQEMYREWPFFRSLLDNAQMSLAKCDFLIFDEYLTLAPPNKLADQIKAAFAQTVKLVEEAVGGDLLSAEPRLDKSIQLRNPYIDPIHRLQVELLRRVRENPELEAELQRPMLLSIQGIAAGVRNTG